MTKSPPLLPLHYSPSFLPLIINHPHQREEHREEQTDLCFSEEGEQGPYMNHQNDPEEEEQGPLRPQRSSLSLSHAG